MAAKKLRVVTLVSPNAPTQRNTAYVPPTSDSRYDNWIESNAYLDQAKELQWFDEFRTPKLSTGSYVKLRPRLDIDIIKNFQIKTIDFGNWVSQFNRINFLALLNLSCEDLAKMLGTLNLGKGKLIIDWGGRGQRRALGLYKPYYKVLNLRRHERLDKLLDKLRNNGQRATVDKVLNEFIDKKKGQNSGDNYYLNKKGIVWLLGSSGFGSFAHEFGHFMDNVFYEATHVKHKNFSMLFTGEGVLPNKPVLETDLINAMYNLSGQQNAQNYGISTYSSLPKQSGLYQAFFNVFVTCYYTKTGDKNNPTYKPNANLKRLIDFCEKAGGNYNYWGSFCECWARIFESYTQYYLDKAGIKNTFLVTPQKKFEVQQKVIDGRTITVTEGSKVYVSSDTLPKLNKYMKEIFNTFATIKSY